MKRLFTGLILLSLIAGCGTPKPIEDNAAGSASAVKRLNRTDTAAIVKQSEPMVTTSTQVVPIQFRTDPGALEGSWQLQSADAVARQVAPKADTVRPVAQKRNTPAQKSAMHVTEKPGISFFGANETFSGYTGCNKFSGRYSSHKTRLTCRTQRHQQK